jgi:hypothetical protein
MSAAVFAAVRTRTEFQIIPAREVLMLCLQCVHWTVESFTYATLKEKWDRLLGTPITPGYR